MRIKGHPLHPILVTLPIGLWSFSFACDLLGLFYPENSLWQSVALYALVGGLIGALLAGLLGAMDMSRITVADARRTALAHMSLNLAAIAVFGGDVWLRMSDAIGTRGPVVISAIGMMLIAFSSWLGGELVYGRHAVRFRRARAR